MKTRVNYVTLTGAAPWLVKSEDICAELAGDVEKRFVTSNQLRDQYLKEKNKNSLD